MALMLSGNEASVLRLLLANPRCSKVDIGKSMGISSQAVKKIIGKLQDKGIIEGYGVRVNLEKLGVGVYAMAFFKLKAGRWDHIENSIIRRRMNNPHIIKCVRFTEGEITHMAVYGFRDIKELNRYFQILQTQRGHISELKRLSIISAEDFLKDSADDLILALMDKNPDKLLGRPIPVTSRGSSHT
jgi:DNA-binding Lrp family transcriptional regulator